MAFGEPGPQDHTVRLPAAHASVRGNVLYRRDGRLGEVLHRPMIIEWPLLRGTGKSGGQTSTETADEPASVHLGASERGDAPRRERPGAEYGAADYPVRLYEHSLACVGAIEDFLGAIAIAVCRCAPIDEAGRTVLACLAGVEPYRTNRPVNVPGSKRDAPGPARRRSVLVRSETFIYTFLTGHRGFEPSVICHAPRHVDGFPFPRINVWGRPTIEVERGLVAGRDDRAGDGPFAVAPEVEAPAPSLRRWSTPTSVRPAAR